MANQAIHYVRWVFIHRFVGQHDVKDVFVITKSIQTTRIELGMRTLLERVPLMIAIHGTRGLGQDSRKVVLLT